MSQGLWSPERSRKPQAMNPPPPQQRSEADADSRRVKGRTGTRTAVNSVDRDRTGSQSSGRRGGLQQTAGRYLEGTRAVWGRPVGSGVLSLSASPLAGDHVIHIDFFPFSQNRHGLFW